MRVSVACDGQVSDNPKQWTTLDKMASQARVARPLQRRRLQARGLPSYTNAPGRWSAGSLPTCEETGHG
jgi:hypothetical protein